MSENNYRYWKLKRDASNIVWLHFDMPDSSANLLSQAVIGELSEILSSLTQDLPQALIIVSDKKDSFIFGADIKEFVALDNKQQALQFLQRGHALMDQLEALPCTTVSMIHGICFGGGTELSGLRLHRRIR